MMESNKEAVVWVEWHEVKDRWWLPGYRIVWSVVATVIGNILGVIPIVIS